MSLEDAHLSDPEPPPAGDEVEELDKAFLRDALEGLTRQPKQLHSKYFYDERGSRLFERITRLPEYYLTRTERSIMETYAAEMAEQIGAGVMLIEFGSGNSTKTRILLDHLEAPATYVPVDISEEHLLKSAEKLRTAYPDLEVLPLVADFTRPFDLPDSRRPRSHAAVYFPGSTIGNFIPEVATGLLRRIARTLGPGGGMLIGVDLRKDAARIEAAYNDSQRVTDQFNLNILRRMNVELGADFDIERFRHKAVYDPSRGRIESFVVSLCDQTVTLGGRRIEFAEGEHLHTEYSYKYTVEGFAELAAGAGFTMRKAWTDPDRLFAVLHLVVVGPPGETGREPASSRLANDGDPG